LEKYSVNYFEHLERLERLKRLNHVRPNVGSLSNGYRIRGMLFPSFRAKMPAKRRGN
jgi:hypothetical protein